MIKHAVGMVLFSFIVGTSAFVAGLFSGNTGDSASYSRYDRHVHHGKKKKKKKRKRRHGDCPHRASEGFAIDATVTNAVFNSQTGQLTTTVAFSGDVPETFDLDLHFWVRDDHGERFLKTETISASPWTNNYVDRFDWMARFGQLESLYVIPTIKTLDEGWNIPPDFDVRRAAPVKLTTVRYNPGGMGH